MNLQELQEKIDEAYNSLVSIFADWAVKAIMVAKKERETRVKEAKLLLGGTIDGKNAAIRQAQMDEAMKEDNEKMTELKDDEFMLKARKDVAEIRVAHARALLRIAELMEVKDEN
jgi:hypothetical protein